jgi:hypothetical protein
MYGATVVRLDGAATGLTWLYLRRAIVVLLSAHEG